ncbi:MAG: hypothetical protein U1F08_02275 [Steroidobacteraceae bacterium]
MHQKSSRAAGWLASGCLLAAAMPVAAHAESADEWKFDATLYAWLPSIDVNSRYPSGGTSVTVSESQILDALNFTFMGAMDARKDRWGIGTDLIYLNLGGSKKETRQFEIDGNPLPVGVTAKASLDVTGWLWTTVGFYRAVEKPNYSLDLLAGARMLNLAADLKWSLSGDLGDPPVIARNGHGEASGTLWDGIVGLRGRASFGDDNRWFIPYYVDVGTGDSDLTWQGIIGAGYAFDWGDVEAVWRYLDYNMPSKDPIESSNFNGAAIGVTFHF